MEKLKVGQSFEVVEWVKIPAGLTDKGYLNKQCIKVNYDVFHDILTPRHGVGMLCCFEDNDDRTKPIGKLTITSIKKGGSDE